MLAALATLLIPAPARASRLLVMDGQGAVHVRHDRFLAPRQDEPAARRPAAIVAHAASRRTPGALRALLAAGAITQSTYDRALGDYDRASALARRLSGARRIALRGVLGDLEGMASHGAVTAARLPALMATLEANNRWWTTGPLLSAGARVSFTGSGIVWQHYPGHGIQIQWLATWGRANGLWADRTHPQPFADLVDEAISLAGRRGEGIAFEYLFAFDGGDPPWVSGLAQGTALTAMVRAGDRFGEERYFDAARSAIGIFRVGPPEGVAQPTAAGTHYLQYSFAPRLHILNGFIQSLNGLFDYATVLDDPEGRALFEAGSAEARAELPRYDTGGWSKYSEFRDSDLAYHTLLREFLARLCQRLGRHGSDGEPYCDYASRFTADLTTPPVVGFVAPPPVRVARRPSRVGFTIDKPGTVTLVITRGSYAYRAVVAVTSGGHALAWRPPAAGLYAITISATDLAGNSSTATSEAAVVPRR